MEDVVCGGGIIARLNAEVNSLVTTDASRAAKILYEHFSSDICGMLEGSDWGQYLSGIGLNEDVRICARIDSSRLVPVYKEGKVVLDR